MIALLLLGCGPGDPDAGGADSADTASDTAASDDPCVDAPVVTWDNFGAGFLTQHCTACHASSARDRHGAPADVTFDTEAEALAWSDRILARAAGDAATMPPQGGVSNDDRTLLGIWLGCD